MEISRILRSSSASKRFRSLFPQVIGQHSSMIKAAADDGNVSMRALIYQDAHAERNLQFVFLNKKFLFKSEFRSLLNELLSKMGFFQLSVSASDDDELHQQQLQKSALLKLPKYAVFILNISCPHNEYCVTLLPDRRHIDFKDQMRVKRCLVKLVDSFCKCGQFGDKLVLQCAEVSHPQPKTKSTFMPRLLFEKMNRVHMIRGLPAQRKIAATMTDSNAKGNPDAAEIDVSASFAASAVAEEELPSTSGQYPSAREKLHQSSVPSPQILNPLEESILNSVILEEPCESIVCTKNENTCENGTEPTHRAVSCSTPCTPVCSHSSKNPILWTENLLNRHMVKNSVASSLNTSRIHQKLLSTSVNASKVENVSFKSKYSFTFDSTCNEECTLSYHIPTNSNICLYDKKRKYHLRRTKTTSRKYKLNGLHVIKAEKIKQGSKKKSLLRKPVLQVDDGIHNLENQNSQFIFNPKLCYQSRTYSEKVIDQNQLSISKDLTLYAAPMSPVRQTTEISCILNNTIRDEVLMDNNEPSRFQSILSATSNPKVVSNSNENLPKRSIPTVEDFIYAINLKKPSEILEKKAYESQSRLMRSEKMINFSGISISENEIGKNRWCNTYSELVPVEKSRFSTEFSSKALESKWFSSPLFHSSPVLDQTQKLKNENFCELSHCRCSCHKVVNSLKNLSFCQPTTSGYAGAPYEFIKTATVSSTLAVQNSPSLFSRDFTNARISEVCSHSVPEMSLFTGSSGIHQLDTTKAPPLGIFSELAELYCGTKRAEASQCQMSSNIQLRIENGISATNKENILISCTPEPVDTAQLAYHSVNLEDTPSSSVNTKYLSEVADASFCGNLENVWVGNTPAARCVNQLASASLSMNLENSESRSTDGIDNCTQFSNESFTLDPENSEIINAFIASESTQLADNPVCNNSRISDIRVFGSNDSKLVRDSVSIKLKDSRAGDFVETTIPTQQSKYSFCFDSENLAVDHLIRANSPTQLVNDTPSAESNVINCSIDVNSATQVASDSVCVDLKNCSLENPICCKNTNELEQLKKNERDRYVNDVVMEKSRYQRKSKFVGSASVFDIPKGILDVQSTKSKSFSFEKSKKIDFDKFTMPCSMKNHLTIGKDKIRVQYLILLVLFPL